MRSGKIPAATAAILTASMATPDNSNFVFLAFDTTNSKLVVKTSAGSELKSAALA